MTLSSLQRNRHLLPVLVGVMALALFMLPPLFLSTFMVRVFLISLLSTGLAVSWNILGGFAGYWSFGHTLYVGVGAFTAGKLVPLLGPNLGGIEVLTFSIVAGGLVSGMLALVLAYPLLRLRGIYFAIAMLGVAELTGEISSSFDAIGGAMGLTLPIVVPENINPAVFYYYLFLALNAIILVIAAFIKYSRFGYGLASIREDEDSAKMLGVPTERYKIIASVISCALVGISGVLYGFYLGYFTTTSVFRVDFSLNMILHTLIGGIGTLFGPILGAWIMVFLTQFVLGKLLEIHILITGLLVIIIVLLAPSGIIGAAKAWLEKRQTAEEGISKGEESETDLYLNQV